MEATFQEVRQRLGFETQRHWSDMATLSAQPGTFDAVLPSCAFGASAEGANATGRAASGVVREEASHLLRRSGVVPDVSTVIVLVYLQVSIERHKVGGNDALKFVGLPTIRQVFCVRREARAIRYLWLRHFYTVTRGRSPKQIEPYFPCSTSLLPYL
jgi:hypothetical protein